MFKIFKKIDDDSYEFKPAILEIEETPINPIGRSILWIIVAIIIFSVFWLFFAKVDVVVSGTGKFIPSGDVKILKPLENGIVSKILVNDGDKVKKGDPLVVIDPSVSSVNLTTQEEKLKTLNFSIARLNLLISSPTIVKDLNLSIEENNLYTSQKMAYDDTVNSYKFKIDQIKNSILSIKENIKKLDLLKNIAYKKVRNLEKVKDIIASQELQEAKAKFIDYDYEHKSSIKNLNLEESKFKEITKELENFKNSSMAKWIDELLAKQKEASELSASINALKFQTRQQIISSPVDGYVGKLLIHTIGASVNGGEELMSIIPINDPLIISAKILNKDIGFLQVGQDVAIKVDTFNFQKYGKIDGKLIYISNNSLKDEKLGEIFEIKVKPDRLYINVDKKKKFLEPGMSVVTEIKVGKRRVIELFIYPIIKYLDEGLSVR